MSTAIVKSALERKDEALAKAIAMNEAGTLLFPKDYSPQNAVQEAWIVIKESGLDTKCTPDSIGAALYSMVVQGLSISKKQCYPIPYGNKLTMQRSYFGTTSLAKRCGMQDEPIARVVYADDVFEYGFNTKTGELEIYKHEQKLQNIHKDKIIGGYVYVILPSGRIKVLVKTMDEIRQAWMQGQTKGQSPAHKNFPAEMACRTLINAACKLVINTSDDSYLFDAKDEESADVAEEKRNETVRQAEESTSYIDVTEVPEAPTPEAPSNVDTSTGEIFPEPDENPYA